MSRAGILLLAVAGVLLAAECAHAGDDVKYSGNEREPANPRKFKEIKKRSCIQFGANCEELPGDCCPASVCRCNKWGADCRCQSVNNIQKWH